MLLVCNFPAHQLTKSIQVYFLVLNLSNIGIYKHSTKKIFFSDHKFVVNSFFLRAAIVQYRKLFLWILQTLVNIAKLQNTQIGTTTIIIKEQSAKWKTKHNRMLWLPHNKIKMGESVLNYLLSGYLSERSIQFN